MVKVGDVYYHVITSETAEDQAKQIVEIIEYHVVTIRGKFFYMVWKLPGITWGKRSKKNGDIGWIKPFPAWTRVKFHLDPTHPYCRTPKDAGYFKSKLAAIRNEIKTQRLENFDEPELYEKAMRSLRSTETRLSKLE